MIMTILMVSISNSIHTNTLSPITDPLLLVVDELVEAAVTVTRSINVHNND